MKCCRSRTCPLPVLVFEYKAELFLGSVGDNRACKQGVSWHSGLILFPPGWTTVTLGMILATVF